MFEPDIIIEMEYKEIEVRFLEIDKEELIKNLHKIGADDLGEDFLREVIFYDKAGKFRDKHKFVRLRENKNGAILTYKQHMSKGRGINQIDDVDEIETKVDDPQSTKLLLDKIGLDPFRVQEKYRHSFIFNGTQIEIDTWPKIPTYVEIESSSEEIIKNVSKKLGLAWKDVYYGSARDAIEKIYKIPVSKYRYFTFDKVGD